MSVLLPGFAAPGEAQSCFRAVLEAMSRPGTILTAGAALTPPEQICPAAAAALLTLVDNTTSVSLPDGTQAAQDWLVFHTGARLAPAPVADFVLAWDRPDLAALRPGTYDEPETSALLIVQLRSLEGGSPFLLTGPGIETACAISLPLDKNFVAQWQAQSRRFPLGIDILLCAGSKFMALPRSVSIEAG